MPRLQPRPKAVATSNLTPASASSTPGPSISKDPFLKVESPTSRSAGGRQPADPVSQRATLFLIRRTLCTHLSDKGRSTPAPINEILPPLTSSNEVDVELYAFIAIIIREFVQTWYSKITPDPYFVEEVVKIIAHCTRALEQRLRKVDLESLLFDELPDLLETHVQAYRTAHYSTHPSPLEGEPRKIYHSLWPFPALAPVPDDNAFVQQQMNNEAHYRQLLVHGILAVLLPTEDLENDCLTTLVGQIFSEMILGGGIGGKASEPWLLWEGITKVSEVIQDHLPKSKAKVRLDRSNSQSLSQPPVDVIGGAKKRWRIGTSIQRTFWLILQYAFLTFTTIRFLIITIATSPSLPSRIAATNKSTSSAQSQDHTGESKLTTDRMSDGPNRPVKRPIIKMKLWSCFSNLFDLDFRMPWLYGMVSMLQWGALAGPGEVGNIDGMLDKILSHAVQTHVLDPSLLPLLLRTARSALFPNNTLAPPRTIPSPDEQLLIRHRCAEAILSLLPAKVQDIYFGAGIERRVGEVEEVLDVFSDSYCNKHLLYGIVELIVVRLIPELDHKGVDELLEERLS
ncbi:PXA domain protein 1 [Lachnellula cervina]|uniref:PXA domain protein 1 n=1 Tax=Lachnellula cervina TaxID=1316786 RepID=A0A7D8YYN4_9HELO|nr:PXA domain protein 1 [Lachnellula cervina]